MRSLEGPSLVSTLLDQAPIGQLPLQIHPNIDVSCCVAVMHLKAQTMHCLPARIHQKPKWTPQSVPTFMSIITPADLFQLIFAPSIKQRNLKRNNIVMSSSTTMAVSSAYLYSKSFVASQIGSLMPPRPKMHALRKCTMASQKKEQVGGERAAPSNRCSKENLSLPSIHND